MLHNNEFISIEEILVKPKNDHERPIRQFILYNRNTNLKICIYALGARVMSCLLNEHEIIVGNDIQDILTQNNGNQHDQDDDDDYWDSHVYGSDTILLNNRQDVLYSPRQTLTYCLTKNNEFIIEGNDFTLCDDLRRTLLINPFFFNLNSFDQNPCLDEHYLHIRASHESINVFTEQQAYGQFGQRQPSAISDYMDGSDFVYSTDPTSIPDSFLIATLSYKNRIIEILLKIDRQTKSSLRILIKNGSIAFVPHDMNKFKVTYRFYWSNSNQIDSRKMVKEMDKFQQRPTTTATTTTTPPPTTTTTTRTGGRHVCIT